MGLGMQRQWGGKGGGAIYQSSNTVSIIYPEYSKKSMNSFPMQTFNVYNKAPQLIATLWT